MSATVTWATTRDQRVVPCYYFSSGRRHSDSGLSSDVSDDDSRVITISDNDSDGQIYENISFHQQRVSSSNKDSIVSNVTSFPAPPLNFRDNPNIDQSSQEKDQIVLNNDSEGFHDWHQDDDDQTNKTNKESSLDFDFSVKTLRRKKVSRHNFVDHYRREQMILSKETGTIRGIRHRVKQIRMDILDSLNCDDNILDEAALAEQERGRCVVYLTSLGVIRETVQRCDDIRKIFRNMFVRIVEKDLYLSKDFKLELEKRLQLKPGDIKLPLIFLNGSFLGDFKNLEKLNETGELRDLMLPYQDKDEVGKVCERCGNYRVLPCPECRGSRVGSNMWHGRVKLRCTKCDMSGLVSCSDCQP